MQKQEDPKHESHHQTKRSPRHTKQLTLNNSRSRINENKHKHRMTEQSDPDDNIRMINQSMVELQDPQFIADQIDQFQSKLVVQKVQKGFCQVTREKSLLLSNTQGYRKYKKDVKVTHNSPLQKQAPQQISMKTAEKEPQKQKQPTKIVKKEDQQQSLCYSSESQIRKRIQQKQSIGISNISNISNTSVDIQKNEQAVDDKSNLLHKHQSF